MSTYVANFLGPEYDAKAVWDGRNWLEELPAGWSDIGARSAFTNLTHGEEHLGEMQYKSVCVCTCASACAACGGWVCVVAHTHPLLACYVLLCQCAPRISATCSVTEMVSTCTWLL